jgi:CheY-like chemotaxis protein
VDWKMPGMDGIELARWIKGHSTEPSIVAMVSSAEWNAITSEAHESGVDKFLSKPLFPSSVTDCINSCLGLDCVPDCEDDGNEQEYPCFEGCCLLLAEDVDINREILQSLLEPTRINIDFAQNGKEAVSMFNAASDHYDLIFMDIHMPEMDGYEATRNIRKLDSPRARTVPIVAMTANAFHEDVERCLAAGMNAHVSKPLDIKDVIEKLKQYLPARAAS